MEIKSTNFKCVRIICEDSEWSKIYVTFEDAEAYGISLNEIKSGPFAALKKPSGGLKCNDDLKTFIFTTKTSMSADVQEEMIDHINVLINAYKKSIDVFCEEMNKEYSRKLLKIKEKIKAHGDINEFYKMFPDVKNILESI